MKTGRPPVDPDDSSVDVHLTLPSRQYDATYEQARRERTSVQEIIRRSMRESADKRNPK